MAKRAIVVAIEGLGVQCLGPYGNSASSTKILNQLASRSVVCENMIASSPLWTESYQAIWGLNSSKQSPLFQNLRDSGVDVHVLSDRADFCQAVGISEPSPSDALRVTIEPAVQQDSVEDVSQTAMGQIFLAALKGLASLEDKSQLYWIHSKGWNHPWDAPFAWREQFGAEEDPPPPDSTEPPEFQVTEQTDPDLVTGWIHSSYAQAQLLDECIASLDVAIDESGWQDDCLFIVLGLFGYPMGEHGVVGNTPLQLHSETIQLPCLIRPGNRLSVSLRFQPLIQPAELGSILQQWFESNNAKSNSGETENSLKDSVLRLAGPQPTWAWPKQRQLAVCQWNEQLVLRTPAWFYYRDQQRDIVKLYAKPDDRWETNDVARRAADIVELMEEYWRSAEVAWRSGDWAAMPEIPSRLLVPVS